MVTSNEQRPVILLREGTNRSRNKEAQATNILAAKLVVDAVSTTLGPRGMDKMLVDSMGDMLITNDGVTILKEMDVQHPIAQILVNVAKTQDSECGDGTTTAVILSGSLLREAEKLLEMNIHPTIIIDGYRAAELFLQTMYSEAILDPARLQHVPGFETRTKEQIEQQIREHLAITTITGKYVSNLREPIIRVVLQAFSFLDRNVPATEKIRIDDIQILKKSGKDISQSQTIDGVMIEKSRTHLDMPVQVEDAKILCLNSALETKKTEIEAKITIDDPSKIQMFLEQERRLLNRSLEQVRTSGATVVFCQKGIDDQIQEGLARAGIFAVRRVKQTDLEKIARTTGAKIVTSLEHLSSADLGFAKSIIEEKISDEDIITVSGGRHPRVVSILLRGSSSGVLDEVERCIHDALKVLLIHRDRPAVVAGAGAFEMFLATRLREYATQRIAGRQQLAVEAFASALESIPRIIAENSGMDGINTLISLKNAQAVDDPLARFVGINPFEEKIQSVLEMSSLVIEPLQVKTQAISSATEVVSIILRIDDVIAATRTSAGPGPGGPQGMPPGMM